MNKIIKAVAACAAIGIVAAAGVCAGVCLSGCEDDSIGSSSEGVTKVTFCYMDFSHRTSYRTLIAYDNKTHVMYAISDAGAATPLYNPDGSLRIYTEG